MLLEKEFEFYKAHQDELVKKYDGKYIIIQDNKVIGAYDDRTEAYEKTKIDHEVGTFLIQYCTSGDESYTQTFHSLVTFR